jgi:hypothetical protein
MILQSRSHAGIVNVLTAGQVERNDTHRRREERRYSFNARN